MCCLGCLSRWSPAMVQLMDGPDVEVQGCFGLHLLCSWKDKSLLCQVLRTTQQILWQQLCLTFLQPAADCRHLQDPKISDVFLHILETSLFLANLKHAHAIIMLFNQHWLRQTSWVKEEPVIEIGNKCSAAMKNKTPTFVFSSSIKSFLSEWRAADCKSPVRLGSAISMDTFP